MAVWECLRWVCMTSWQSFQETVKPRVAHQAVSLAPEKPRAVSTKACTQTDFNGCPSAWVRSRTPAREALNPFATGSSITTGIDAHSNQAHRRPAGDPRFDAMRRISLAKGAVNACEPVQVLRSLCLSLQKFLAQQFQEGRLASCAN